MANKRLGIIDRARGGMADTPDLGSGSVRIRGSSPLARTTFCWVFEVFWKNIDLLTAC